MPTTPSNARSKCNPNRAPKAPLTVVNDFEIDTIAPSNVNSHAHYRLPNHRTREKAFLRTAMRSEYVHETPVTSQMNASLIPFSTFLKDSASTTHISSRLLQKLKPNKQSPLSHAGTVIELAKHRQITHHVGATHQNYPATIIGDTLLKQQAILTINSLPSLIDHLKQDLIDIKSARASNISATLKKTEQKDVREQTSDTNFFDAVDSADATDNSAEAKDQSSNQETASDTETQSSLELLAKQMQDAESVLLRFDARSARKIGARELAELKLMGVVGEDTEAVTQREAHSAVTAEIAQLEAAILGLGR